MYRGFLAIIFCIILVKPFAFGQETLFEIDITEEVGDSLPGLGPMYLRTGNCQEAIKFFEKQLENIDRLGYGPNRVAGVYNYLGGSYFCDGDLEKALEYYHKSLEIRKTSAYKLQVANSYTNIGLIHGKKKEFDLALDYHLKALKMFTDSVFEEGVANSLNNVGEIYHHLGQYDTAELYFMKSNRIAQRLEIMERMVDNHRDLVENFFAKKEYDKALSNFRSMRNYSARLNRKNAIRLAKATAKYERTTKNYENQLLVQEIQNRKNKQYAMAGLLFLTSIIIVLLVLSQKKKKKAQAEEVEKLMNELKLLKAEAIVDKFVNKQDSLDVPIDKQAILQFTQKKLNDTDWKILDMIYRNPTISNKEIAEEIHLSVSGIKSSFTKMYELFNIEESVRNKKLNLAIKIIKISQKE